MRFAHIGLHAHFINICIIASATLVRKKWHITNKGLMIVHKESEML